MAKDLLAYGQRKQFAAGDLARQWVRGVGLAAAVGVGYFLAAVFSVRFILEPEGVAGGTLLASSRRRSPGRVCPGSGEQLPTG